MKTNVQPHAKAGEYCPTCECQHCTDDREIAGLGHEWVFPDNERLSPYCVHCGANGDF
mgnify:CR=1 FL=1